MLCALHATAGLANVKDNRKTLGDCKGCYSQAHGCMVFIGLEAINIIYRLFGLWFKLWGMIKRYISL